MIVLEITLYGVAAGFFVVLLRGAWLMVEDAQARWEERNRK